jgi:hypothetical protein
LACASGKCTQQRDKRLCNAVPMTHSAVTTKALSLASQ